MEELVENAMNGDTDAFNEVLELLQLDLYKVAMKFLKNEDDAKDIVQEALLKCYINIKQLKDPKCIRKWAIGILINECYNSFKISKRTKKLMDKMINNLDLKDNDLTHIENKILSEKLLEDLSVKEKIILGLHFEDDYTIKDIAKHLDMTESGVKNILYRSISKMNQKAKRKKYISTISIIIIVILAVNSSMTIAGRIMNKLRETIKIFQVNSTNGIDDAISENYFETVNSNSVYDNGVSIKIDKVTMDNKLLYVSYLLDFGEDKEIEKMKIVDYKISDETNNILAMGIASNVGNVYASDYSSGGEAYSTQITKLENGMWSYATVFQVIYDKDYPVSNNINIEIEKISAVVNGEKKEFVGNWNFNIGLDDKFKTRKAEYYKCENNDKIKNISAKLNDLSLELEVELNENINKTITRSNNIILQDENGDAIECYLKVVNTYTNKITYIFDIGKYSKNIDKLNVYIKYDYAPDSYVDLVLEKEN